MNPCPINIVFQEPIGLISMGIGQPAGFIAVPEDRFRRNIPAAFMSTIRMAAVCIPGMAE